MGRTRRGCGDDDQATVIEGARVAATGRYDRREEA